MLILYMSIQNMSYYIHFFYVNSKKYKKFTVKESNDSKLIP